MVRTARIRYKGTDIHQDATTDEIVLLDANENRTYAVWSTTKWSLTGKVVSETCLLMPSIHESKNRRCASRAEFDAFVASYME
jgi:hypothetical protein